MSTEPGAMIARKAAHTHSHSNACTHLITWKWPNLGLLEHVNLNSKAQKNPATKGLPTYQVGMK